MNLVTLADGTILNLAAYKNFAANGANSFTATLLSSVSTVSFADPGLLAFAKIQSLAI